MIEVFYFILMVKVGSAASIAQAGPFITLRQCNVVRYEAIKKFESFIYRTDATECYSGVIK